MKEIRRDENNLTEKEYLEAYSPGDYKRPSVTADVILFTYDKEKEKPLILLIQRKNHPCIGMWALPGGFIEMNENLEDSALRELKEETGLERPEYFSQLYMWGDVGRDKRTRIITCSYIAVAKKEDLKIKAGDDAALAELFEVELKRDNEREYTLTLKNNNNLISAKLLRNEKAINSGRVDWQVVNQGEIGFDHAKIIAYAIEYMSKQENSQIINIIKSFQI